MVEERLPTTRISSGCPLFTASATLGRALSVVSRCAGTSQLEVASELADAAAGVKRPASIASPRVTPELDLISLLPPYPRCRWRLLSEGRSYRRRVCTTKSPCHPPHDQDSANTDNEMHRRPARDLGQDEMPGECQEHSKAENLEGMLTAEDEGPKPPGFQPRPVLWQEPHG